MVADTGRILRFLGGNCQSPKDPEEGRRLGVVVWVVWIANIVEVAELLEKC